jgi:hypothetical protein
MAAADEYGCGCGAGMGVPGIGKLCLEATLQLPKAARTVA